MFPRFILNNRNNFIFVRVLTLESFTQRLGSSVPFRKRKSLTVTSHGCLSLKYGGGMMNTELLLCARHSSKCFIWVVILIFPAATLSGRYYQ